MKLEQQNELVRTLQAWNGYENKEDQIAKSIF